MPITESEFYAGRQDAELAALSFLKQNRTLGYTAEDIMVELGNQGIFYSIVDYEVGLENLVAREMAESRVIDGAIYYKYFFVVGFRGPRS